MFGHALVILVSQRIDRYDLKLDPVVLLTKEREWPRTDVEQEVGPISVRQEFNDLILQSKFGVEIVIRQVITITSVTGANVRFPVCKLGGKLVPPERLPGLGQEDTNPRFGNQAAPRVMN